MSISRFTNSEGFFDCSEPLSCPEIRRFDSVRGRMSALGNFFGKLAILPLAFVYKLYKTALAVSGVGFGAFLVALTLFSAPGAREFFVNRVMALAKDLADWVFWPVAVVYCLCRLLLAATLHPALYFS